MKKISVLIISILFIAVSCGDKALFDELATNRIKVILKGTYESNNPRPWDPFFDENVTDYNGDHTEFWDDSIDDFSDSSDDAPSEFMMDIAEMRITDGHLTQKFGNYRKTYSYPLDEYNGFFNGEGILFQNDDVRPDYTWRHLHIYFRKMLFNKAQKYYYSDNEDFSDGLGEWKDLGFNEDIFAEEDVLGLNFLLYNINSYYDLLRYEYESINRIFPLTVEIEDTFAFNNEIPETVLEIRIVIKNFIKKYEHDYIRTIDSIGYHHIKHFYALSDWLRDVQDEGYLGGSYVSESRLMGGNIIATARAYVPDQTVTLQLNAGANNCYVMALNEKQNFNNSDYKIEDVDRIRPNCDEPKKPYKDWETDLEHVLDYHLKMQKYMDDYDDFIDCVNLDVTDDSQYNNAWTNYNDKINEFKIPPLATWVNDDSGEFELTYVPTGQIYTLYRSVCNGDATSDACNVNELPGNFIEIGTVTVEADPAEDTIISYDQ